MQIRNEIRKLVRGLLTANGDAGILLDQDSLLLSGRLQSIDAVEIVVFLEGNFGINFAEIGFDRELIDSIDAICSLVESAPNPMRNVAAMRKDPGSH